MNEIVLALLLWANPTTIDRETEVVEIGEAVVSVAEEFDIDKWKLAALVVRESGVRVDVVGKLGERGPAQVLGRYIGMSNEELATADGGVRGAAIALRQWERHRPRENPWECYAAGNRCHAPRAERRLHRIASDLRGYLWTFDALVIHSEALDGGSVGL